jgi:hypothetical protein
MDTFEMCRIAAEKASWSYDESVSDLRFDFSKLFLPAGLCGSHLPKWLTPTARTALNHIRGFSYAHIFLFVEEIIIPQVCRAASNYIHSDSEALSALLRFTDEETKHQRMFVHVKSLIAEGLGFQPAELPNKEEVARTINRHSSFAVFLLTLALEWLTQRHYIECFQDMEDKLDSGFVKIFRLHWREEAQHARLDALELQALAQKMSHDEIKIGVDEFADICQNVKLLLREQDQLDLKSLEIALGETFEKPRRSELLNALHKEYLWVFLKSGLEHKSFKAVYKGVVPAGILGVDDIAKNL